MANATHFPTAAQLALFQWANPTYPRPQLRTGVTATLSATTLNWTAPPLDKDGAIITAPFLAYIRKTTGPKRGLVALAYCPNGANGTSGLSSTGCILGIRPSGFDYTTGDADFLVDLDAGDEVGCADASVIAELLRQSLQGGAATGSNSLIIGADNAAATVTIKRSTTPGNYLGWLQWNLGSNKVEFSDDGVAWAAISDVTASVTFKASVTDTTPGYLIGKAVPDDDTIVITLNNGGGDETVGFKTGYSATKTEIDQVCDGVGADATAANLTTLTNGSNADVLHTHLASAILPAGVDGEVLIYDSGDPDGVVSGGRNRKVLLGASTVTLASSTTETALASVTIPGGLLETAQGVQGELFISDLDILTTGTLALKLKYGATVVGSITISNTSGGNRTNLFGRIKFSLFANGATNAQVGVLEVNANEQAADLSTPDFVLSAFNSQTATEDSTGDLTLQITGQWNNSSASNSISTINRFISSLES